jgi:ubiquinone biosynthesis protein
MMLQTLTRLRNAGRLAQISAVLVKYGFANLVDTLGDPFIRLKYGITQRLSRQPVEAAPPEVQRLAIPVRVRLVCEELGPTFIKLGQLLSTRGDLLPAAYVEELKKLQDAVPPIPFAVAKQQIEAELEAPLGELYSDFSPEPLAAASVGQVHVARLPGGERVAVKVQRPGVDRLVERDLSILMDLAQLLEGRLPFAQNYRLTRLVREFTEALRDELIYTIEAHNADRLATNLAGEATIRFPHIFWSLTTRRVFTAELLEGIPLSDPARLDEAGYDRARIARLVAQHALRQILIDGFFHADPHPGNIFALPDGRLGYVDFGIVGRLDRETREVLGTLLLSLLSQNTGRAVEELVEIGVVTEESNREDFEHELDRLLTRVLFTSRREVSIGELLARIMELGYTYRIALPAEFSLLAKTLIMVEGLCMELDPNFDLSAVARPFVRRLIGSRLEPGQIVQDLATNLRHVNKLLVELPRQLHTILRKASTGSLTVRLEPYHAESILHGFHLLANRLAVSLMAAALVVASALVWGREVSLIGFSLNLGLLGLIGAGLLGFWLFIAIVRSGKL